MNQDPSGKPRPAARTISTDPRGGKRPVAQLIFDEPAQLRFGIPGVVFPPMPDARTDFSGSNQTPYPSIPIADEDREELYFQLYSCYERDRLLQKRTTRKRYGRAVRQNDQLLRTVQNVLDRYVEKGRLPVSRQLDEARARHDAAMKQLDFLKSPSGAKTLSSELATRQYQETCEALTRAHGERIAAAKRACQTIGMLDSIERLDDFMRLTTDESTERMREEMAQAHVVWHRAMEAIDRRREAPAKLPPELTLSVFVQMTDGEAKAVDEILADYLTHVLSDPNDRHIQAAQVVRERIALWKAIRDTPTSSEVLRASEADLMEVINRKLAGLIAAPLEPDADVLRTLNASETIAADQVERHIQESWNHTALVLWDQINKTYESTIQEVDKAHAARLNDIVDVARKVQGPGGALYAADGRSASANLLAYQFQVAETRLFRAMMSLPEGFEPPDDYRAANWRHFQHVRDEDGETWWDLAADGPHRKQAVAIGDWPGRVLTVAKAFEAARVHLHNRAQELAVAGVPVATIGRQLTIEVTEEMAARKSDASDRLRWLRQMPDPAFMAAVDIVENPQRIEELIEVVFPETPNYLALTVVRDRLRFLVRSLRNASVDVLRRDLLRGLDTKPPRVDWARSLVTDASVLRAVEIVNSADFEILVQEAKDLDGQSAEPVTAATAVTNRIEDSGVQIPKTPRDRDIVEAAVVECIRFTVEKEFLDRSALPMLVDRIMQDIAEEVRYRTAHGADARNDTWIGRLSTDQVANLHASDPGAIATLIRAAFETVPPAAENPTPERPKFLVTRTDD